MDPAGELGHGSCWGARPWMRLWRARPWMRYCAPHQFVGASLIRATQARLPFPFLQQCKLNLLSSSGDGIPSSACVRPAAGEQGRVFFGFGFFEEKNRVVGPAISRGTRYERSGFPVFSLPRRHKSYVSIL
ncbi:hypothetical protein SETIT_5G169800v2 [Setaria italica]|uniref:Uncharacterized protein n=2 Tax=Setaria TaxID=4554 RepID=A0A368R5W5_SETIT|nr:hypothetical protein SETIT_5G169800v2 [Setaria italica]TKW14449.1 hypothetical protein SEVIR_5G169100v2 [Setaria viridis]